MKTPSGWSSSWPSLLARCRILYAALTGQISGCLLSVFSVIDCPFSLFFWIRKVTLTFFSTVKSVAVFFSLIIALFLSWMIKSRGVNAFMTRFPEGYSCTSISFCVVCAYSATRRPNNRMTIRKSVMTALNESCEAPSRARLWRRYVNISLVMGLHCLTISSSRSLALIIFVQIFSLSDSSAGMVQLRNWKSMFMLRT